MMAPEVICIGELLVDFVATEPNVALPHVTTFTAAPGGAPANVAVAIRRLGRTCGFVGKVGDDVFGIKLRETLNQAHVDTSHLAMVKQQNDKQAQDAAMESSSHQTTIVFGSVWEDGHKELCFYRGADRCLEPNDISATLLCGAKCLHYGSITLLEEPAASAQRKAMKMARDDMGLMMTFDPNYRPTLSPNEETAHRVIMEGFRYCHLAKVSQEEWHVATGHEDLQAGIRAVMKEGVELLVVSRGENGALATNGEFIVTSPALLRDIKVVETTGAGDGFMAAMITRLLPEFEKHGGSLKGIDESTVQAALDYANAVGGLTCTKAGAIPALPTASEVEHFLSMTSNRIQKKEIRPSLPSARELAQMIDHTFLKPYCCVHDHDGDIERLCQDAREFGFAMVAVNPAQVERCVKLLAGTGIRVGAAVGFPLGQTTSAVKAFETRDAIQRGATEIDMVLNIRELQQGNMDVVKSEVETLVQICHDDSNVFCKVILETCYLTDEQKVKACEVCRDAGVDFVKSSTGLGTAGATVEDIMLMRRTVGDGVGVKASGGIRDLECALAMIDAGANRIGTSCGVSIMQELLRQQAHKTT
jgi:deoxyribose-phosphate aldolase